LLATVASVVQEYGLYTVGKRTNSKDRMRSETINPATREVLASFPQGTNCPWPSPIIGGSPGSPGLARPWAPRLDSRA